MNSITMAHFIFLLNKGIGENWDIEKIHFSKIDEDYCTILIILDGKFWSTTCFMGERQTEFLIPKLKEYFEYGIFYETLDYKSKKDNICLRN